MDGAHDRKRWLTPREQVQHLKGQGIAFSMMTEAEAEAYLIERNNFFRLRAYRGNFWRIAGGPRDGQYVGLDFGLLVDLATIDMHLRNELLPMTLDVEHFAKMRLLHRMQESQENAFDLVRDFILSYEEGNGGAGREGRADGFSSANPIVRELKRGLSTVYLQDLVSRRPGLDFPIWEFLELISFGKFTAFVRFCSKRCHDKELRRLNTLLQNVRVLRNACAHNCCIINNFKSGGSKYAIPPEVSEATARIGLSKGQRRTKLKNERLKQIATTLYAHRMLCSPEIISARAKSLAAFSKRSSRHIEQYPIDSPVRSGLTFIALLIDAWYREA